MNQKAYRAVVPASLVVVMVAFLSVIFLAAADPSYAATGKKKPPVAARISAVDYTESQIKQLQSALNFTETQEVLWNGVTQVMRENAKVMDALTKDKAENFETMNAVERMKHHSQTTEAHLEQMKKLIPPFEALYSSMSDEQKKITDTTFRTGKHMKKKMK
jgi:hypothetical protein